MPPGIIGSLRFHALVQETGSLPPPKPGMPPSFWVILVVGALFIAIVLPRLRRRRDGPVETLGSFGASAGGAREELERLLTEIQDLSREHIARLDTKIRMLNQLLLECDQKKRELEGLLGKLSAPEAPSKSPPRSANPLHDQVYTLQDSGKQILDICAATGLEKGEVELILGLRKMPPA